MRKQRESASSAGPVHAKTLAVLNFLAYYYPADTAWEIAEEQEQAALPGDLVADGGRPA